VTEIRDPRLLWLKFGLFVLLGALAAATALILFPDLRLACLMALAIWSFSRAYYFAFYVIEHYVDPSFRFAGLVAFLRYALCRQTSNRPDVDQ
jgi:hypothetical protein